MFRCRRFRRSGLTSVSFSGVREIARRRVAGPWCAVDMTRALVLNASFEPLNAVSSKRAVQLVLAGRAEIVAASDFVWRSSRVEVRVPLVIRLLRYVRVPYRTAMALSRRAIFDRDGHRCGYCGHEFPSALLTLDHVIPRSRGGRNAFENVVTACGPCNSRKADRTPREAKMALRFEPYAPRGSEVLALALGRHDPSWLPYLRPDA